MEVFGVIVILLILLFVVTFIGLIFVKGVRWLVFKPASKATYQVESVKPSREEKITFLFPFRSDNGWRQVIFEYLYEYYRFYFPDEEFIIAGNDDTPFCKTKAVNEGFRRSTGDVIVMIDADCYIEPFYIDSAVSKIREARNRGQRLWFIPYRRFYRLTEQFTKYIIETYRSWAAPPLPDPPPAQDYEPLTPGSVSAGHWFGALIQIYPWEAFEAVGGMDERFHGWGGEDVSFMHALDTLYAKHKTLDHPVYHFWHPSIKGRWKGTRQWEGQASPEQNDWLSTKYEDAIGDPAAMKKLTEGGT